MKQERFFVKKEDFPLSIRDLRSDGAKDLYTPNQVKK